MNGTKTKAQKMRQKIKIFDILYTFENAADVLIEQDIKIDKTIYVMGEITAIYKELLKAEEYYQFFKTL